MSELEPWLIAHLERPFVGVLGTVSPSGAPHLAAVWYTFEDGELLIATSVSSRKAKNVTARPMAELCVNAGSVGPCVTARGDAGISGPATVDFIGQLARRYLGAVGGDRYMAIRDPNAESVLISIKPTSWRIWDVDAEMASS